MRPCSFPNPGCALALALIGGFLFTAAGCKDKITGSGPTALPPSPPSPPPAVVEKPAPVPPAPPVEPQFAPRLGAVLPLSVPVRAEPRPNAQENGRIHCGDVVQLLSRSGDWYKLQLGELGGYAHNAYVIEIKPGSGIMPACEADHLGLVVKSDPPRVELPREPAENKRLSKKHRAKANERPAPDAEPAPALAAASTGNTEKGKEADKPAKAENTPRRPPENTQLSTSGRKAEVSFPHLLHTKVTGCAKCHHPLSGGTTANADKKCHDCHEAGGKGESTVSNKDAFHRVCRDCHNTMGQGPTACAECHVKK